MNEAESWIENRYEDENGSEDGERMIVSVASESATCISLTCSNLKAVVHPTVQVYADVVFTKMSVPANSRHGGVVLM